MAPPNTQGCQRSANIHGSTPASSYHPGGVNLLMADSSVRFVRDSVSPAIWSAAGGVKDGIPVSLSGL